VTGNIFLVNSILAFCAACASGKGQSYALFFLLLLTVPALVLSIYGTVLAFQYEGMLEVATLEDQLAGLQLEMSKLQSWIFEHLRTAFVAGYESCSPVAVRTTDVRRACAAFYPESACSRIVPGYIGLFCKRATGPFEVDSTFAFQPPDQPLDYSLLETTMATGTQFSQWLNWACMPTAPDAAAFIAEAQAVSALTPGPVVNETFISCYRTDWWQPSPLTQADGFTSYPNGSAMTADSQFFHALTAAEGATLPTNPKSTFCFCAHRGAFSWLSHPPSPLFKWSALAVTVGFFLLAFAAEIYLLLSNCASATRSQQVERERLVPSGPARTSSHPISAVPEARAKTFTMAEVCDTIKDEFDLPDEMPAFEAIELAEVQAFGQIQDGPMKCRALVLIEEVSGRASASRGQASARARF